MEPKLFILNTRFLKLFEKRGTFDASFTREDADEFLCLSLIAADLHGVIGNDAFVIISNPLLSSMHAAKIIKNSIDPNDTLGDIVYDVEKVNEKSDELICWDEYLKREGELRDADVVLTKLRNKIAQSLTLGKHVIFLPLPETIEKLLLQLGVPKFESDILNENKIGGEFVFVFDQQIRFIHVLNLVSYIYSAKVREEKLAQLFVRSGSYEAALIFLSIESLNLVTTKLGFLKGLGYDTSKLSETYSAFLEEAL